MNKFIDKAVHGELDSDRHIISIFAIALASRGKTYVELGVREGHTSEPLYEAAKLNDGHLWSVDLNDPSEYKPDNGNYTFYTTKDLPTAAWTEEDNKVIFAMKKGLKLLVTGESSRGTVTNDTYTLKGFTASYNKLIEDC